MKLLEGKTALITGASRGIGKAIALKFAAEGANVAFSDLKYDDLAEALEKELNAMGVKGKGYASDASSFDGSEQLVNQIIEDFGKIDILVSNAGVMFIGTVEDVTEEDWDLALAVNLKSVFLCSKAIIPHNNDRAGFCHVSLSFRSFPASHTSLCHQQNRSQRPAAWLLRIIL